MSVRVEAEPATRHLIEAFGKRMKFVFRHFPLVEMHPHAELAAEAAEAAAAQDKFWAMHHLLFTHSQQLTLGALTRDAEMIGLDMRRFSAGIADRVYTQRVHEHRRSGELIGLRGSPAFVLNGTVVDVSFGLEHLENAVRAALGEPWFEARAASLARNGGLHGPARHQWSAEPGVRPGQPACFFTHAT